MDSSNRSYGGGRSQKRLPVLALNGTEEGPLLMSTSEESTSSMEGRLSGSPGKIRIPLLVGMGLWLVAMAIELSPFIFMVTTNAYQNDPTNLRGDANSDDSSDDNDDAYHALWKAVAYSGVYDIRPCSFEECASSPCTDALNAPFACLALRHSLGDRGGCGGTPWRRHICADQCDATGCALWKEKVATNSAKRDVASVEHCDVDCPAQWCRQNRQCGDKNAAYQCTSGLSIYGCSSDRFRWTVRSTETDCSSCCKTTSCQ